MCYPGNTHCVTTYYRVYYTNYYVNRYTTGRSTAGTTGSPKLRRITAVQYAICIYVAPEQHMVTIAFIKTHERYAVGHDQVYFSVKTGKLQVSSANSREMVSR